MKAALIVLAVFLLVVIATNTHFAKYSAEAIQAPRATTDSIPQVEISSSLDQSDEAGPDIKLVLLALLPHGFETNEIQLEAGDYLLIIGNRTGLREVNVHLDREGKERVAAASVGGRQRVWKKRLKFTPGSYIVTADNNPEWICRIAVRP